MPGVDLYVNGLVPAPSARDRSGGLLEPPETARVLTGSRAPSPAFILAPRRTSSTIVERRTFGVLPQGIAGPQPPSTPPGLTLEPTTRRST